MNIPAKSSDAITQNIESIAAFRYRICLVQRAGPRTGQATARGQPDGHTRRRERLSPRDRARGIPTFDYGNNIRQVAHDEGVANAFDFPGFVPAYIRPAILPRQGTVPLGGVVRRSGRHRENGSQGARALSRQPLACTLARPRRHAHRLPGIAGAHLLARPRRASSRGARIQRYGRKRRAEGADRHRPRSPRCRVGREPNRETESMADGSDAVSDWPLLNALLNTASGATWVSLHHGGGVGMATRSTRGSWSCATVRRKPRRASRVSCGTIRRPA